VQILQIAFPPIIGMNLVPAIEQHVALPREVDEVSKNAGILNLDYGRSIRRASRV